MILSEPMRRQAGSSPHIEDMRYPSESRYGFFSQLSCGTAAMQLHRDFADREFFATCLFINPEATSAIILANRLLS